LRRPSEEDEARKERFFNDTVIDVDLLNQSTPSSQRRSSTHRADDDDDDVDELLGLLQDLGDERENLLNAEGAADADAGDDRRRRRDEQDELDSLEMSQICWDVDPFDDVTGGGNSADNDRDGDDGSAQSDDEAIWDGEKTFWENLNLEDLD